MPGWGPDRTLGRQAGARAFARMALTALALSAALVVGGCQLAGTAAEGAALTPTPTASAKEQPVPVPRSPVTRARIDVEPADDAEDVRPDRPVTVEAAGGWLTKVTVTDEDGDAVPGAFGLSGTSWRTTTRLTPDTAYEVEAVAVDAAGVESRRTERFRTLRPAKVLDTDITPSKGSTVGVGMPIVVKFSHRIEDRAAVERQLVVTTSKPVEGAWHWFDDREVRYRPRAYWPGHTEVTLSVKLRGVASGTGAWGVKDRTRRFTIGRSVVTKVNLYSHQATVYVDGKPARTIPVTGGKPGWETRRGTKLVIGRQMWKRFTNEQIGAPEEYDLVAKYALRITVSGEFVHTAHWSVGSHGRRNVSHGCVGMNTRDSGWLYALSKIGDPVETVSNGPKMPVRGNGYGDWNMSWEAWKAGSAL